MDSVFKALADPARRELLDRLHARNGQTLSSLAEGMGMARQSVTKHLRVLEAANLVATMRRGREKLHYLNAAPIQEITERWIDRYDRDRARALSGLKHALEETHMGQHAFVYTTYIRTTPEQLWRALTDPDFTRQYWGVAYLSDWKVGSPLLTEASSPGEPPRDLGQVVLESDPPRRLSYSWHNYQPEHKELFGWSDEQFEALLQEPRSRVTFEIEPSGGTVRLTVIHEGFETETEMLKALSGDKPQSGGWPQLLASLKTLLETGEPLYPRA